MRAKAMPPATIADPRRPARRPRVCVCLACGSASPSTSKPDFPAWKSRPPRPPPSAGFRGSSGRGARFRHRGSSPCQARQPGTRCLIHNRPILCATDGQDTPEDFRKPQRAGSTRAGIESSQRTIAAAGIRAGVGLRPGQGVRLAPPGPAADCRVQAGSARRSSGVMRGSTALRTSGPALCSMALQSAVLWMVATMPRSAS